MSNKFREDYKARMVFGGRFLQMNTTMTTDAAAGMPPMTMSSLGYVGYDNARQKYVHSMIGDWSTSIGSSEGTFDEATKTFTMHGTEVMGPDMERKFRMVHRIVSPDEWVFEMYFTGPDGQETKAGEATYRRKAPAPPPVPMQPVGVKGSSRPCR
jgi:hypothetical protein